MKRAISVLLAFMLLLSVAACSNQGASPSPSAPAETAGAVPTPAASSEPEQPQKADVVKLNIFKEGSRPMNAQTDTIRQWMIDELGVDMELTQVSENFNQQLALLVTTGDIPDLTLMSYDTYLEYAAQGAFSDITNDVANYENLNKYVGDLWEHIAVDGKIYGVPSVLNVPTSHVTNIRKDWLDNVGLDQPTTIEELTEVMRAFTFNDPDKNGKNDTYGFSCYGYEFLGQFLGAFGATSAQHYFLNDDNTITTNAISQNYREGLAYLRDIYAEGLIDPEIFTATYEQAQQKWGRGEMGVWTSWWSGAGNAVKRFGFEDLQPGADVQVIAPTIGANNQQASLYAPAFDSVLAIAHDLPQEKIDAILRLLDYQSTPYGFYVVQYGIENVGFELDKNGVVSWQYGMDGKDRLGNEVSDMETYKLLFNEQLQRYAHSLADDLGNKLYWQSTQIQFASPSKENLFAFTKTPQYTENNAELTRYFTESAIRFIMGVKDLDTDWEEYTQGYLNMGGEAVRRSLLEAYNAKMGTAYTFAE